jgi:hypothetical protein
VPSIAEVLKEIFLQPVHYPFRELVNAENFRRLIAARLARPGTGIDEGLLSEVEQKAAHLLWEINAMTQSGKDEAEIRLLSGEIRREVKAILEIPDLQVRYPLPRSRKYKAAVEFMTNNLNLGGGEDFSGWATLLGWAFTHSLGKVIGAEGASERSRSWIDEWLLGKIIAATLQDLGSDEGAAWWAVGLIKLLISHQHWFDLQAPKKDYAYLALQSWLEDGEVQRFLQVNRYQGILWFNQEAFENLLSWFAAAAAVQIISNQPDQAAGRITGNHETIQHLLEAEAKSAYQIERLLEMVRKSVKVR